MRSSGPAYMFYRTHCPSSPLLAHLGMNHKVDGEGCRVTPIDDLERRLQLPEGEAMVIKELGARNYIMC